MGEAFTFNHSSLKEKIDAGEWLEGQAQEVQGRLVRPYLVADSAFALTQSLIKGYDYPPAPGHHAENVKVTTSNTLQLSVSDFPIYCSALCLPFVQ